MLALLPQEIIDRYEPIDIIGYGAFAMVIKARDKRSGKLVAIKHLQAKLGDRKKFFREFNFMVRLRHPNIVSCIDVSCSNEKSAAMIFEFADGGTLREQIKPNIPLRDEEAFSILYQILRGLEYAHNEGIVHRDLKPENILIFKTNQKDIYKISDFGVAKLLRPNQKTATSIGSPIYMAPEQFYDSYDFKSDIYGLGIVLFEMTHGLTPFEGSPAEIFKGHLEKTLPYRDDLSDEMRRVIADMTLKTPGARPSASELLNKIEEFIPSDIVDLENKLESEDETPNTDSFSEDIADDAAIDKTNASFAVPMELEDDHAGGIENESGEEKASEEPDIIEAKESESNSVKAAPVEGSENDNDNENPFGFLDSHENELGNNKAESINQADTEEEDEVFELFPDMPEDAPKTVGNAQDFQKTNSPKLSAKEDSPAGNFSDFLEDEEEKVTGLSDVFGEGFDTDVDAFSSEVVQDLKSVNKSQDTSFGRFKIQKQWNRGVDTKTKELINLEDNGDVLLHIYGKGLQEIKPGGKRGKMIAEGTFDAIGQPILGNIPILMNKKFCVMQRNEFYESDWNLEDQADNLALSHDLKTVATFSGSSVTCRKWGGNMIWNGQFDRTGSGTFMTFLNSGTLLICSYQGEDQAVHFFNSDGDVIVSHWMSGSIHAACRLRSGDGAFVIVEDEDGGAQLYKVTEEAIEPHCGIEKPIYDLVCSEEWLCGRDEDGKITLIDLTIGLLAEVPEVEGELKGIAVGASPNELYILTLRNEVLNYVTGFTVELVEPELNEMLEEREPEEAIENQTAESFFSGGF